jgi:hypothetical protein
LHLPAIHRSNMLFRWGCTAVFFPQSVQRGRPTGWPGPGHVLLIGERCQAHLLCCCGIQRRKATPPAHHDCKWVPYCTAHVLGAGHIMLSKHFTDAWRLYCPILQPCNNQCAEEVAQLQHGSTRSAAWVISLEI